MTHGSLFSGIGGFDLAAEWMGWNNVFHCEFSEFPKKVLKKHFPKSISYDDITKTDFNVHRGGIDILTGGFPCQPYSVAGLQKGTNDDRHLWPEMLRAVREIQPVWVVGENVHGIVNWNKGLVFNEVQANLEAQGYEVQAYVLPACGVNAPHRRERVWFVAYSLKNRIGRRSGNGDREKKNEKIGTGIFEQAGGLMQEWIASNSNTSRFKECWPEWFTSREFTQNYGLASEPGICRGNDGFPYRVDRLKGLGNAIVPQVALQIFKAIEQYEFLTTT